MSTPQKRGVCLCCAFQSVANKNLDGQAHGCIEQQHGAVSDCRFAIRKSMGGMGIAIPHRLDPSDAATHWNSAPKRGCGDCEIDRLPVGLFSLSSQVKKPVTTIWPHVAGLMASHVLGAAPGGAYTMVRQRRWQCAACRRHVSLTFGTVLHHTKTPLTLWFWAMDVMTTDTRGVSALLLQHQLRLTRYEPAWMMLHQLRRAMVNVAREPLRGRSEARRALGRGRA